MKPSNDELMVLIEQCSAGNQFALEKLYKQLAPSLNAYAYSIVRCRALSNDIIQESFIKIWEASESYLHQRGTPLSWIYAIVRHKAIDKIRAEKKHQHLSIDLSVDDLPCKQCPDNVVFIRQSIDDLENQLGNLAPNEKLSILLAFVHGYSRQELADMLDTNVNTIKSWIRRGLKHIRSTTNIAA